MNAMCPNGHPCGPGDRFCPVCGATVPVPVAPAAAAPTSPGPAAWIAAVVGIAAQNTASLMEAATGLTYTPDDILQVGERINNLARAFNTREGLTRADDTLPERLLTEPLKAGASKGHFISKEELTRMLDDYYAARGWNVETGAPTREKLSELGLDYVADQLA